MSSLRPEIDQSDLKEKFKEVSFFEYSVWVQGKEMERTGRIDVIGTMRSADYIIFDDGSEVVFIDPKRVEHPGYSEWTPGWTEEQAPELWVRTEGILAALAKVSQ